MLGARGVAAVFFTALFLLSTTSIIGVQATDSAYVRAESYVVVEHENVTHDSDAYTQAWNSIKGAYLSRQGSMGIRHCAKSISRLVKSFVQSI